MSNSYSIETVIHSQDNLVHMYELAAVNNGLKRVLNYPYTKIPWG